MYTPTITKLELTEGLDADDIIEIFESFDRDTSVNDVLGVLDENMVERSFEFHVEHKGERCWEHPVCTDANDGAHVLGKHFFTLYRRDTDDGRTMFTLTTGRVGNTAHRCWLVRTTS